MVLVAKGDVPAFMARLRQQQALSALALEFTILTGARIGETLGAMWHEIDIGRREGTIPAARAKMKKEHRVPLCDRAIEILRKVGEVGLGEFVFPGQLTGRPLTDRCFKRLMIRMKNTSATTHGFRSSSRDWIAEKTDYSHEVAEMVLAHAIPSAVERAYRRGDLFEKRRELMRDWGDFCCSGSAVEG